MKRDAAVPSLGVADIAIPSADDYMRRAKVAASRQRARIMLFVHRVVLAFRTARIRALVRGSNAELDKMLNELGGVADDALQRAMPKLLHARRDMANRLAELRETILNAEAGCKGPLISIIVRLLDDTLEIVGDDIETLELSVDQEVRDHLAREIRQIAASS